MNSETLLLRALRIEDEASFRNAAAEFSQSKSDMMFAFEYSEDVVFAEYVERVNRWPEGRDLPADFVSNAFFVGVVDHQIVGRISFRHCLTEFLARVGGHIGYVVLPSQRNRGYATEMVRQSLKYGRSLGLAKVLITCDTTNLASQRVIERNGGVYEDTTQEASLTIQKHRYWIPLAAPLYDQSTPP
jgi:predicted acetyltransferase